MADAASLGATLARLRLHVASGVTRDLAWRRRQLEGLEEFVRENRAAIAAALDEDLGKSSFEAHLTEVGPILTEIAEARRHLRIWTRPRRVAVPLHLRPGCAEVRPEPYGVALILAPWNYPLQLTLVPLVSALAAGNGVIVKPSELAAATAALLERLLPRYLDPEAVAVVTGPAETAAALAALPVDCIFCTGSPAVGRKVMAAAAANLTPVTLELGGKCPVIVEATARVRVAARRIVWGKFLNAGQTCVAPDYVLVDRRLEEAFLAACVEAIRDFFGPDPLASPDYSRIINDAHVERLMGLLDGGRAVCGGVVDRGRRRLAPTILRDVDPASALMQEEIFGPVLPVLPVASLAEAVANVNARPPPLALYLFTESAQAQREALAQTRSGGVCVNDVVVHLTVPGLPFGGLGASGMGSCHGQAGFEAFTHRRSVLQRGSRPDPDLRYPPYGRLLKAWVGYRPERP